MNVISGRDGRGFGGTVGRPLQNAALHVPATGGRVSDGRTASLATSASASAVAFTSTRCGVDQLVAPNRSVVEGPRRTPRAPGPAAATATATVASGSESRRTCER